MKALLIAALCLAPVSANAGKWSTALAYEGIPHKVVKTERGSYFILRHKKGDNSVLVLLNRANGDKAQRQATIDNKRGFYDVGADYAKSIGCKPKGTITNIHWNMSVVPYIC